MRIRREMKIKEKLKFWKGQNIDREPPPKDEWPTSIEMLEGDSFQEFIEKFPVTLIDFHSPTCAPCRAMKPRLRKLSKRYEYRAAFGKLNINENSDIAEDFKILSVPTFIIFSYGKQKKFMKGKKPLGDLKRALDDVLQEQDEEKWF